MSRTSFLRLAGSRSFESFTPSAFSFGTSLSSIATPATTRGPSLFLLHPLPQRSSILARTLSLFLGIFSQVFEHFHPNFIRKIISIFEGYFVKFRFLIILQFFYQGIGKSLMYNAKAGLA